MFICWALVTKVNKQKLHKLDYKFTFNSIFWKIYPRHLEVGLPLSSGTLDAAASGSAALVTPLVDLLNSICSWLNWTLTQPEITSELSFKKRPSVYYTHRINLGQTQRNALALQHAAKSVSCSWCGHLITHLATDRKPLIHTTRHDNQSAHGPRPPHLVKF